MNYETRVQKKIRIKLAQRFSSVVNGVHMYLID